MVLDEGREREKEIGLDMGEVGIVDEPLVLRVVRVVLVVRVGYGSNPKLTELTNEAISELTPLRKLRLNSHSKQKPTEKNVSFHDG